MARLHRSRTDRGHISSRLIAIPSLVLNLAGPSEYQPILLHVAAAADNPSVTVDHEKPSRLTASKVCLQGLRIQ